MLPFLGHALVPLWEWADRAVRVVLGALAGLSAALSFMCATTIMAVPVLLGNTRIQDELFDFVLPAFWGGQVHNIWAPLGAGGTASVAILAVPVAAGILLSGVVPQIRRRQWVPGADGPRRAIDTSLTWRVFAAGGWNEASRRTMMDLFDRRIARAIFLSLWALYACIGPGMSAIDANSISRIGLVFSIVQRHALDIDPIAPYTIDKAEVGGHTYLDKAPGLSFMAVPVVAVIHAFATRFGMPTVAVQGESFSIYYLLSVWAGVVFSAALLTAAAAAVMYPLARHLGAGRAASLFGTLTFALCTPAFGWATAFFGHGVAGACLLIGFAFLIFASATRGRAVTNCASAFLAGVSLALVGRGGVCTSRRRLSWSLRPWAAGACALCPRRAGFRCWQPRSAVAWPARCRSPFTTWWHSAR